jgi:hypothetical protein
MTRLFVNLVLGVIGVWTVVAFGGMIAPTSLAGAERALSAVFHITG